MDLEICDVKERRRFVVNGKDGNRARSRRIQFLRAPKKLAEQGYEAYPRAGPAQECSKCISRVPCSVSRARKRSSKDWVFRDSRIRPHPTPIHRHPGPQNLRLRPLVTNASQERVVRKRAVGVSRHEDALDREGVEHVEKAADVVGVRVAHGLSGIKGCYEPSVTELETARLLLRPWREEDLDPYAHICTDPEVMQYMSGTMTRYRTTQQMER
jgi:hypothetical protein